QPQVRVRARQTTSQRIDPATERRHRQVFAWRRARDGRPPPGPEVISEATRREPPWPDSADHVEPAVHDRGAGRRPRLRQVGTGGRGWPVPGRGQEGGRGGGAPTGGPPNPAEDEEAVAVGRRGGMVDAHRQVRQAAPAPGGDGVSVDPARTRAIWEETADDD